MNLPVQPGADTHDDRAGGVLHRLVSATDSGARSANFACLPGNWTVHLSTTSTDGTVCALTMTGDAVSALAMTLAGAAVSTVAAPAASPAAIADRHPPGRHRLHLAHFHRSARVRDRTAGP